LQVVETEKCPRIVPGTKSTGEWRGFNAIRNLLHFDAIFLKIITPYQDFLIRQKHYSANGMLSPIQDHYTIDEN
jgi:hypothetical protein